MPDNSSCGQKIAEVNPNVEFARKFAAECIERFPIEVLNETSKEINLFFLNHIQNRLKEKRLEIDYLERVAEQY